MALLLERETKLACELKRTCDDEGKERDPPISAKIIYQLGLVYRDRAPDKFSLIKCAGLLNAALVRKPSNDKDIRNELSKVCKQVLKHANAKNQNANLMKKSTQIKREFNVLRSKVKAQMETFTCELQEAAVVIDDQKMIEEKRISGMQDMQQKIADQYLRIMSGLCKYCEGVMGKPPCSYAVAGMGSLARKEITPYSDFEHVILLEEQDNYESNVEYFRWYSVIFHVILLNLRETIIPSLNISSLNGVDSELGSWFYDAHTPRGVSFDGMMPHACKFPLGRQEPTKSKQWTTELIKPVSEMLNYLSSEQNLKNGYHLSDILTKTCFVYGDDAVYELFAESIRQFLETPICKEAMEEIKHQVKEDLDKFSTRFRLVNLKTNTSNQINIKEAVYRSLSLFISALGRLNHISKNSCFDIIKELAEKSAITEKTKRKLLCALSIACQFRLIVYLHEKSQKDHVDIQTFLKIIEPFCIMNYFQITYCLQCLIAKYLSFSKLHFYSQPQLINITFFYAFGMNKLAVPLLLKKYFVENIYEKYFDSNTWKLTSFQFDSCLEQLESQIREIILPALHIWQNLPLSEFSEVIFLPAVAEQLCRSYIFDEALEFFRHALHILENPKLSQKAKVEIAVTNLNIGKCLNELNRPSEASKHILYSLIFFLKQQPKEDFTFNIAMGYLSLGVSFLKLCRLSHSLNNLNKSSDAFKKLNEKDYLNSFATLHKLIGQCLCGLKQFDKALDHLINSQKMYLSDSVEITRYPGPLADVVYLKANCLVCLHRESDALDCFKEAMENYHDTSRMYYENISVGRIFMGDDQDLMTSDNVDVCVKKSKIIFKNFSLNPDKNENIAAVMGIKFCEV